MIFEKKNLVNNFKDNWYWSSTDFNNFAYHLGFISGDELLVPKEIIFPILLETSNNSLVNELLILSKIITEKVEKNG